jgi:hypothetical protein
VNGFPPTLSGIPPDPTVREIACCFAAHLRTTRSTKGHPIKAVTIDQYITHVADYLVTNQHILNGGELRSRRLTMLLAGYTAKDDTGIPLRLRQKIPMTYPLACIMYRLAGAMHTGAKRLALRAPPGPFGDRGFSSLTMSRRGRVPTAPTSLAAQGGRESTQTRFGQSKSVPGLNSVMPQPLAVLPRPSCRS